jgi:signal transduction histidine kinase
MDEAKMARALETIDRNTKSLAMLIEDILDVSRIMTGKLHLSADVCQLVTVVEGAIESVRPAAEAKTIELELCGRSIYGIGLGRCQPLAAGSLEFALQRH